MPLLSELLKDKGIRPSWQRLAIAEFMLSEKTHPSAEEVYEKLSETIPTLSKATVYNTLNLFAEKGLIRTMNVFDVQHRYDGIMFPHGHVVCPVCGKIVDFVYREEDMLALEHVKSRTEADNVEFVISRKCDCCRNS